MKRFHKENWKKVREGVGMYVLYPMLLLFEQLGKLLTGGKGTYKRILAGVVAASIVLSLVPAMRLPVFAATGNAITSGSFATTEGKWNGNKTVNLIPTPATYGSGATYWKKMVAAGWGSAGISGDDDNLDVYATTAIDGSKTFAIRPAEKGGVNNDACLGGAGDEKVRGEGVSYTVKLDSDAQGYANNGTLTTQMIGELYRQKVYYWTFGLTMEFFDKNGSKLSALGATSNDDITDDAQGVFRQWHQGTGGADGYLKKSISGIKVPAGTVYIRYWFAAWGSGNDRKAVKNMQVYLTNTSSHNHTHQASDQWSWDASYHWQECTVDGCTDTQMKYAVHNYEKGIRCTECGLLNSTVNTSVNISSAAVLNSGSVTVEAGNAVTVEDTGNFFLLGNSTVKGGNDSADIMLEKGGKLYAQDENGENSYSGNPVSIQVDESFQNGDTVVYGSTDTDRFIVANKGKYLESDGTNLVLTDTLSVTYPYGQNMTGSNVTLVADVTAYTYQWQSSESENGEFTDITGENGSTMTFAPTDGHWYRCQINGGAYTEAVQCQKINYTWYLTNGKMAYTVKSNSQFDVRGWYNNGWYRTSYEDYWESGSTEEVNPSAVSSGASADNTKSVKLTFKEEDPNTVCAAFTLTDAGSLYYGTDTMLGSYDNCPLTAVHYLDGALKQIQMVGSTSLEAATKDSASFVITPTAQPSHYWLGHFSDRKGYAYNTPEDSDYSDYSEYYTLDSNDRVIEINNTDSGMTMSWTNLSAGQTVGFEIRIGTVQETGATIDNLEVGSDSITVSAREGYVYQLVDSKGNPVTDTWVAPDANGKVTFEGLDPQTSYKVQAAPADETPSASNIEVVKELTTVAHAHCVCGKADCNAAGTGHSDEINFGKWTETDSLPNTAGNYYLTNDVTLTGTWAPVDGITLCLNGYKIIQSQGDGTAVITVGDGVTLTLCDCDSTGKITHAENKTGSGVSIAAGGTFNLCGGSITGNTADAGGGVLLGGSMTVSGNAKISDNTGSNIYIYISSASQGKITIGELTEGAKIGITVDTALNSYVFSENAIDPTDADYFFADDSETYEIIVNDDSKLVFKKIHIHVWDTAWSSSGTAHWHKCTAADCDIVDYSAVTDLGCAYTTHTAPEDDSNCTTAVKCPTCQYAFTAAEGTHTYTYSANGTVITESCSVSGCTAHTATATISAPTGILTYDGASKFEATVVYSDGWAGGTLVIAYTRGGSGTSDTRGAGDYEASIAVGDQVASVAYTVRKAIVTAPVIPGKVYTGANLKADISDTAFYKVTQNNGGTNFGKYDVVLTLKDAANYRWEDTEDAAITLKFSITKAENTFTETPDIDGWTYGETASTPAGASKFGQVVFAWFDANKEPLSEKPVNAGTYYLKASVPADGDNYGGIASDFIQFEIAKAELTVTAKDHTVIYGDAPSANGVTYGGFVNGDTEAVLGGTLTFDFSYAQFDGVGSDYTVTPKGLTSDNYNITFKHGTLTVTQKEIGIQWSAPADLVFDGKAKLPSATATGLVNGDSANITVILNSGSNVNVGSFTYKATALDNGNYKLPASPVSDSYTVTPRPLTEDDFKASIGGLIYTGNEIKPSVSSENTIVTELDYTVAYESNVNAGEETAKIIITGKNNAGGKVEIPFSIAKATPETDFPVGLSIGTDRKLADILLPTGYAWDDPDTAVIYGTHTYSMTFTPADTDNYNTVQQNVTVVGRDVTAPTGKLEIGENGWNKFWNGVTFGLFFKDTQTVTVTAADTESGVVNTEYHLAEAETEAFDKVTWTAFDGSFKLDPNKVCVVYVKITDNAGNAVILNSDGVVLDNIKPVLAGLEEGKTYHKEVAVTVTDSNLDKVEVNGKTVEVKDGKFTLTPGKHTVKAYDKAGNVSAEVTVTVEAEHDFTWGAWYDNQDRTHSKDGHCICGADLTVTAPMEEDVVVGGLEEESEIQEAIEKLEQSRPEAPDIPDAPAAPELPKDPIMRVTEFLDISVVELTDGEITGSITVTNHVLEIPIAFDLHGKLDLQVFHNHEGAVEVLGAMTSRPTGELTHGTYFADDANKLLYVYLNKFSTIGISYHTHSLTHVEAKAATEEADGNIEHWYCAGCSKYFKDDRAQTEITQEDTVVKYVPVPATGDAADIWLWTAGMLISAASLYVILLAQMRRKKAE